MNIKKIHYKVYGKLENLEIDFKPGLNIIYGENEAGKSTIFNSIKTLVYGFSPANRSTHPYVNWQRDEIDFSAEITSGSESLHITRQLKSAPKLLIRYPETNGVSQKRNDVLPCVSGIGEDLYESVWHLTSEALLSFETKSWEEIQEKLIFNYGIDYIHKGSDVIQKLQAQLNDIWRPDRRGNPRLVQNQREVRAMERTQIESKADYDRLKALEEKVSHLTDVIHKNDQSRKNHQEMLQEIYRLLPVKKRYENIEILKREIQKKSLYKRLPKDAIEKLDHFNEKLSEIKGDYQMVIREIDNLEKECVMFTKEEVTLLENEVKIFASEALFHHYELCEQQLSELSAALLYKQEAIEKEITHLFDAPFRSAYETLIKVNPLDVKTAFYNYMDLRQKNELEQVRRHEANNNKKRLMLVLLIVSILVTIGGLFSPIRAIEWGGLIMMGISVGNLLPQFKRQIPLPHDLTQVKNALSEKLAPLTVPDYVWDDKTFIFASKIETVSSLIFEAEKNAERIAEEKVKRVSYEEQMREALSGVEGGDYPQIVLTLQMALQKLKHLKAIENENNEKSREIQKLTVRANALKARIEEISKDIDVLELEFLNLGEGKLEEGIKCFERNLIIEQRIRVLEEEMFSEIDVLEQFKTYDRKELISDHYIQTLEGLKDELEDKRKSDFAERVTLVQEIETIKNNVKIDEIDGEIKRLKAEGDQLEKRRAELLVMTELIRYADDRFRRENQPDILQRVSYFMSKMTNGKYQNILISDQYELQFLMNGEVLPASLAFSKGTINQLFLSYRLAVIEMLSEDHCSLPVVLDEALINWDGGRLSSTMALLSEFAENHQTFIFTCHPDLMVDTAHYVQL